MSCIGLFYHITLLYYFPASSKPFVCFNQNFLITLSNVRFTSKFSNFICWPIPIEQTKYIENRTQNTCHLAKSILAGNQVVDVRSGTRMKERDDKRSDALYMSLIINVPWEKSTKCLTIEMKNLKEKKIVSWNLWDAVTVEQKKNIIITIFHCEL